MREAISLRRTLHVSIEGDALVDHEGAGLAQVRTVIHEAARLRAQGRILPATLGELATADLAVRLAQPTKSLLKPAA